MVQIKGKILGGILWSVANQVGLQILSIIFTGILSRILLPSDFGLVAMVTLATGFLNVLKDFGFGAALVQKEIVSQEEYSSVFWFNLILGILLTVSVWLVAPFVAAFYEEPNLEIVTKVLSFNFLLTSAGIVWNNILVKEMEFKQIFYRSLLSTLVSGVATVLLALAGYGYWSLVAHVYFNNVTLLLFTYMKVRWRPSLVFNIDKIKALMPFSLPLIGDQSLNYWTRNLDNLLIGKYFGSIDLAYYSRAYSLMLLPVRQISGTITKVLFPSFSLIQNDLARIRNIYFKISGVIALVSFPAMAFLFVMSYEVILLLFGDKWVEAVPIFRILCVLGMAQSIGTLIGNIFVALGKTNLLLRIGLLSKAIMISGIVLGVVLGSVNEVAICYVVSSLIAFIPESYFLAKLLKTDLLSIFKNILNQLIGSIIMGGILYFVVRELQIGMFSRLLVGIAVSIPVYLLFVYATKDKAFFSLKTLINERRNKVFSS